MVGNLCLQPLSPCIRLKQSKKQNGKLETREKRLRRRGRSRADHVLADPLPLWGWNALAIRRFCFIVTMLLLLPRRVRLFGVHAYRDKSKNRTG